MNKNLPDQKNRDRIYHDLNTNLLVEAGAGSGKTTSLVERMTALVISGKYSVDEIAAITFTRKAAAELKERFQEKLEEKYRSLDKRSSARKAAKKALENLDTSFTGTIHSFCSRLLRERPVEAGIDPDFEELDDLRQEILLDQAWNNYLLEVKLNRPKLLTKLEELGTAPDSLKSVFYRLSLYPEVEVVTQHIEPPDLEEPARALIKFAGEALKEIPEKEPAKDYDSLQKAVRNTYFISKYRDLEDKLNLLEIIKNFDSSLRVTLNRWKDGDKAGEYKKQKVPFLKETHVEPVLRRWREYCHYHLLHFLQPGIEYYQSLRRKKAVLSFQDLLLKTASLLKNYSEVREYFQNKYKVLLVDEFQDTDPVQAEIIFYLSGSNTEEKDWTKVEPREGSLFVVGDPKQSIYRFRRADIDIYNLVKELIKNKGGDVLKLTTNFRSLNSIGKYLNSVFFENFPGEDTDYQPAFARLDTIKDDLPGSSSGVKKIIISNDYRRKNDIVQKDADNIARIIKDAVSGSMKLKKSGKKENTAEVPEYKDFMILLRYKDSMDLYAAALEEYGIPYQMTGNSTLGQSLEIKELYRLLSLIKDIDNSVLTAAVLKGLFCGFSDNELYQYKKKGGQFNIYSQLPDNLDSSLQGKFKSNLERLQKYHQWSRIYQPSASLEKIIIDLGLMPYAAVQKMDKSRCSNIYYLLERIKAAEAKGTAIFADMVDEVEVIINSAVETELNINLEDNVVRIMNLHKAKGLEAPVVFLAHPCKNVNIKPQTHIKREADTALGFFQFVERQGYHSSVLAQPENWEEYQEEEEHYQEAEELRLLYVAASRAKNMLIISSSEKKDKRNNPWLKLLAGLDEEDILEIPEVEKEDKEKNTEEKKHEANEHVEKEKDIITPEKYRQKIKEYRSWAEELKNPGYRKTAATEFIDTAELFSMERGEEGGRDWGTAVHEILEEAVKKNSILKNDYSEFIEKILNKHEISLERKEEAGDIIKGFKESKLYQRLLQSDEVMTEVPFSIKVEAGEKLYSKINDSTCSSDVPIMLSGVIDLTFKEKDGWIIVDYKSEHLKNKAGLEKLQEIYKQQLEIYADVWEYITGEDVKEKKLWFSLPAVLM